MYVEDIISKQRGKAYKTILVRESYRKKGKVKHRTVCNISKLPPFLIKAIKHLISQGEVCFEKKDNIETQSSREYGASYAVLSVGRSLGLDSILYSRKESWREDVLAMIVGRVVYQGSKLSLTNLYMDSVLWELCGHVACVRPDVEEHCYLPLDRLLERHDAIQKTLAERHLKDGCLILYDITSAHMEGEYEDSDLVAFGRVRGGKRGCKQIAIGLLTDKRGCPIAVRVFRGNTSDQTTVYEQVKKIALEFGVKEIVFAGDRGMLTPKRITEVNAHGFKTLTALTHPQIMTLLEKNIIQLSLFDKRDIAEVYDPEEPGIRYLLCKNPQVEKEEKATRISLINKTLTGLNKIASGKRRRADQKLSASVGKLLAQYKVGKFFEWNVKDGKLEYSLDEEKVEKEEALDGCYIVRTDVKFDLMNKKEAVESYRRLMHVERAFRNLKTVALEVRPVYHHIDRRIESHVFLCMLAYYIQWHMLERLKPLFEKDGKGKERRWSFQTIIERLKSIRIENLKIGNIPLPNVITTPDNEQQVILDLLKVSM